MPSNMLSFDDRKFLLAVERGDVASTRRMLEDKSIVINMNCVDPLGRTAMLMAIDNENMEMLELLLENKAETKDALLHAINEEYVEAVEVLLDHEESIHLEGEPWSWETLSEEEAVFSTDMTPLVLAAHTNNYEIIKILLDRGASLPCPHHHRCGCDDCAESRSEDSLRHSRRRINAYRALASPSLISLSSKDPILTAFKLSWELRELAFAECEFKSEYMSLKQQCQDYATALLDHTRSSTELEVILNYDPNGPAYHQGDRMQLNRLKMAIQYRQKKFVAHPNVQQLLASIWYEGLPGFRQKNMVLQGLEVCKIGFLFPLFSMSYIVCPKLPMSKMMKKPFIKFICNSASYFVFLFLLILASQRIEDIMGWDLPSDTTKRGSLPSVVEYCILAYVAGLIWSEIKQLWDTGAKAYISDMWNVADFVTNSLYLATIALRLRAYYDVRYESSLGINTMSLPREKWDTWDPTLISEGLFAAANILSSLKLVYVFSVNPYLGPLQVILSRMIIDILKFCFLYLLVLFAFSCGLNQLLWYYADLEKKKCLDDMYSRRDTLEGLMHGRRSNKMAYEKNNEIVIEINHCLAFRKFANLWETTQTLFWASFGLIDLDNFELAGIKEFTRFWGLVMFGSFSVINIIVLLNLLIAMMNHSYQLISVSSEKADTEWKFARSKLWISYFEDGGTVPPPFNIIPTPKTVFYFFRWIWNKLFTLRRTKMTKEHMISIKRRVSQVSERDKKYQEIMRNLVRRYVTQEQRKAENEGVTEDDVNEIKNDISAFRFEMIEIMRASGMNTRSASGPSGPGGKKNRQKERRLMKGYNLNKSSNNNLGPAPVVGGPGNVSFCATIPDQSPSPGSVNTNGGGCLADTESSKSRTSLDTKIEINSKKKVSYNAPLTDCSQTKTLSVNNNSDGKEKPLESGELKLKLGCNNISTKDKVSFCSDSQSDNRIDTYGMGVLKTKVMISGDSSFSDSGLEVRGGSAVSAGGGGAPLRALYRGARVEHESDCPTDCSPSPHSSLLDAPLPPSLLNLPEAGPGARPNKCSSVRIQQSAVRSGWI